MTAERHLRRPDRLERDRLDQVLDPLHRGAVVRVGLVPLEHRELRLVLVRDALVTEVLADLVHLLEPADDEPLEIELRRDAQVEVGIELVVVCHERLRERASVARLEHRRLDLDEAALVEVTADRSDDAAAQDEARARLLVDEQVEIALPVPRLRVDEPVVGVRQWAPRPGEHLDLVGRERRLPTPGPGRVSGGADEVPEVDVDRAAAVLGTQQLQSPRAVDQIQERQLAVSTPRHDTAGHAALLGALRARVQAFGLFANRGDRVAVREALGRAHRSSEPR